MRRRLTEMQLQEGDALTLRIILEIVEQCERVDTRMNSNVSNEKVNKVTVKSGARNGAKFPEGAKAAKSNKDSAVKRVCYWCGGRGHYGRHPNCPEEGKEYRKCRRPDHYLQICKTRGVKCLLDGEAEPENNYAFTVNSETDSNLLVTVRGVPLNVLIVSGASTNVIGAET